MPDTRVVIEHVDLIPTYVADADGSIGPIPTLLAGSNPPIDLAAVFSVLQFGAIVPPLSPWQGVTRLIPGCAYVNGQQTEAIPVVMPDGLSHLDEEAQADAVERLVDRALLDALGDGPDPLLLFSGGTDSGLLASRLVALGRRDTVLCNYSFGENDSESQMAEAMATHLGLRFVRFEQGRAHSASLRSPGHTYPVPFGDPSTAPTSDVALSVTEMFGGSGRPVLDGTGAGGSFGISHKIRKWERLFKVPPAARRATSLLYPTVWRQSGRAEHLLRALRRSSTMPPLPALLAQNPLAGFLYRRDHATTVNDLLTDWIVSWTGDELACQVVSAELAFLCPGVYAQKADSLYRQAGFTVAYPYLTKDMLAGSLATLNHWQTNPPKAALRRSLARSVPAHMAYWPKSAFVDTRQRVQRDPEFLGYLREAIDPQGPIGPILHARQVMAAHDTLAQGNALPNQTMKSVWSIAFTDRWYRTA